MKKEYIKPRTTEEAVMIECDLCQTSTSGHVDEGSMNNEGEEDMTARDNIYGGRRQSIWDD